MEHTILVEGFKACETLHKVRFHKFIADGDSNVYCKLLEARPYINLHIEKMSKPPIPQLQEKNDFCSNKHKNSN